MVDGDRIYPVLYGFLHHSMGSEFVNASDRQVRDWYSDIGKARGYNNGALNPRHEHPDKPGQLSYAMAQYTLREYTLDGNKYGWRLTDLIVKPLANVTWSVGNWWYNQRSFSVEICGNYLNKTLPDKALMLLADELFRPVDKELIAAGYSGGITAMLHQEVFATACPARIKEQRNTLIDMINNPEKWNNILWPPKPKPVVKVVENIVETVIPFKQTTAEDPTSEVDRIVTAGVNGKRRIVYEVTYTDGKETSRKVKSDVTQPAVDQVTTLGTYVKPVEPEKPVEQPQPVEPFTPIQPTPTTPKPPKLTVWLKLVLWFYNKFVLPRIDKKKS